MNELLVFHYECLQGMYFSEYQRLDGGALLFSAAIKDPYYNFYAPDAPVPGLELAPAVLQEFARHDRQPAVYLTPLAVESGDPPALVADAWARDAWLVGEAPSLADAGRSVEGLTVSVVDAAQREPYVAAFTAAYSGDDPSDPYGQLDVAYTESLDASFDVDVPAYRKYYVLATLADEPVGVAAMFTNGTVAGVYGVGTVPSRRRAGIGEAMMGYLARIAVADGVTHIMLQTEAGSVVQRWYEKLGYRHRFTASYVQLTDEPRL